MTNNTDPDFQCQHAKTIYFNCLKNSNNDILYTKPPNSRQTGTAEIWKNRRQNEKSHSTADSLVESFEESNGIFGSRSLTYENYSGSLTSIKDIQC